MSISDALDASGTGNRTTAIYIAVLAVLLSISSVGGDNASKTVTMTSIEAADTYAFYQAKNIRQNDLKLAADSLELQSQMPGVSEATRKAMADKVAEYRASAERYESDPVKNEGKKELLAKAKALEAERAVALQRDPYFDYGSGLLQIAIVLASSALILGGRLLMWVSIALGTTGTAFTVNAFMLLVKLPFLG